MNNKVKFIDCKTALTKNEIFDYSLMIDTFKKGEIDYKTLKLLFLQCGINLSVELYDLSKKIMTANEYRTFEEKFSQEEYSYNDIKFFVFNSKDFKNVIFKFDFDVIELLADMGNTEYQEKLIDILQFQVDKSLDTDEAIAAKRAMWKRRIQELKSELYEAKEINKI